MKKNKHALSPKQLANTITKNWLPFKTTSKLEPYQGMIGQERAMRAIEVGLEIGTRGFNIFAVGEAGSGKTSTLERIISERAAKELVTTDLCYVYNFKVPSRPRPLMLPAGKGSKLADDLKNFTEELGQVVPKVLSDGSFGHIRTGILAATKRKADNLLRTASEKAEALGLLIAEDDESLQVVPVVNGEPIDADEFEAMSPKARGVIESNMVAFQEHLDSFAYGRRQLEREHQRRTKEAEIRAITPLVNEAIGEVVSRYKRYEEVTEFLQEVCDHILENHENFMPLEENGEEGGRNHDVDSESDIGILDAHRIYHVNVLVDRSEQKGAPVVVERLPTTTNMSGYFEYRETGGGLVTDHMMIRPGALHQANGGYLLVQAGDLLTHEGAWSRLKRALRHKEIRLDGTDVGEGRPRVAGMLKPGSVPLSLKVILIGSHDVYYFLKLEDEEFGRLFKILANFDSSMDRTADNVQKLARFLGQVCREEGHLPLHHSGMERVVEYATRKAGHKERMTSKRASLLDLIAESSLFARMDKAKAIRDKDVERAITEKRERHGAFGDAVHRQIREGGVFIQTKDSAVGQINGIALYDIAGNSFGLPVRITARTYAGKRGVVNIDREVSLSGAIHDKGALILVGYLGGRYAQNQTLGLSASITFEQSYDEIDGDSASSAEVYSVLSDLSGCPINQGIAVTGSVNQFGEVQPIGGVNEKIEGIYRVCKEFGLDGTQGVMIPQTNVINLMLDQEVIEAVKAGKFNIYAVSSIDEGIEVLTGQTAGKRHKNGNWTNGSINDLVEKKLKKLGSIVASNHASTILDRDI